MAAELGYKIRLLDIGGGLPCAEESRRLFEEVGGLMLESCLGSTLRESKDLSAGQEYLGPLMWGAIF